MKEIVYAAPYEIQVRDCEIPAVGESQVLLKMVYAGICGSDLQIYHGKHKYMTFPVVGGHEGSAVVVQTGAKVTDFKVGDRVAIEPQITCGKCRACKRGRFNVCEHLKVLGTHTDGLMTTYFAADSAWLHHCPDDMPYELITLVEPLAVAIGSVKRSHYQNANIAVIGAGTIGNLIAQAAVALGAKKVLLTDVLEDKLAYARTCGLEYCVNTRDLSLKEAVLQTFGPDGADVIIDAAGIPYTFQAALDAALPASEIVMTANYKEPVSFEVPRIQRREINLIGHMMYVREDYEDAIRFLYEEKVHVDGFITQVFQMDKIKEGYEYIDANPGKVMKAIIKISE